MPCRLRSWSTARARSRPLTSDCITRMNLKMESRSSWKARELFKSARRLGLLAVLFLPYCLAQNNVLSIAPSEKVTAKRGGTIEVRTPVLLKPGYHVNSHTPSEAYLIPLRLTWEPGPLQAVAVVFPKPQLEKYAFSTVPLSVFTGNFEVISKLKVAPDAPTGPGMALGKLRFQACNHNSCLPPKVIEVKLPVVIQ